MRKSLPLLGIAAALTAPSIFAADWPQFRGPNGSGVNETVRLPTEFGPNKNLVWKTALPPGHSSPILVGDRIFLTAFEGDRLLTMSLDRATGKILWRREAPRSRKEPLDKRNSPASPTPVSDGKSVYVFFGDYGLLSYGIDGNERWHVPLGPFKNVYGMGASPVLVDDEVVLVCDQSKDSFVAAFAASDGKMRWKTPRPEALSGHSTPAIIRDAEGRSLIVAPASFRMDVHSAKTGEIVWFIHGLASEMKSVPIVDGDTIYINGYNTPENDPGKQIPIPPFDEVLQKFDANKDGKISKEESPDQRTKTYFPFTDLNQDGMLDAQEWKMYQSVMSAENALLAVKATGRGDVSTTHIQWKFHKSIPQLPSLVLYRGVIYMINDGGVLTTLDPANGKMLKQARLRGVPDRYYASPVAADGKVFIASHSGIVAVLKAGGDQELLAANKLDEEIFATPAIADGRIYIRTVAALYSFGETPDTAHPSVQLPPELARVLTDYERAWSAKEHVALAQLFAEDGFVLSSGNPPVRGRTEIERHYTGHGGPLSLRAIAYATSGNVGYIIGAYTGKPGSPDDGKFTLTLRKDDKGRWLIMSDMDNGNRRPAR